VFLLDTSIVSELRKSAPSTKVLTWLTEVTDAELHLSVVTLAQIQAGIELTRAQDRGKAQQLDAWAEQVAATYNVLAMDAACFRQWARFMHGQSDAVYEDAMIAATARVHELTVVTRNVRDFARFEVPMFSPFG
jgi:predicted nucleic acid-binding protein